MRAEGLEPPRLASPEPKSGASTNSATPAVERRLDEAALLSGALYISFEGLRHRKKRAFRWLGGRRRRGRARNLWRGRDDCLAAAVS